MTPGPRSLRQPSSRAVLAPARLPARARARLEVETVTGVTRRRELARDRVRTLVQELRQLVQSWDGTDRRTTALLRQCLERMYRDVERVRQLGVRERSLTRKDLLVPKTGLDEDDGSES